MKFLALIACILPAAAATAQTWTFNEYREGGGGANAGVSGQTPVTVLLLGCVRPEFDGQRYARETGDYHPLMQSSQGALALAISETLFPRAAAGPQTTLTMLVDGRPVFRFVSQGVGPMGEAQTDVPLGSPALDALKSGGSLTVVAEETGERGAVSLKGSSRAISTLETFCSGGPARPAAAAAASSPPEEAVRAEFGEWLLGFEWLSEGKDGLAFIYSSSPSGGNAVDLDVRLYRAGGGGWIQSGNVTGVFGQNPRDAAFLPDRIEVTTTTLRPGDARCCPTGSTRWIIDRATMTGRPG